MFPLPLQLAIVPGRALFFALCALHLGAVAALWLADLPLVVALPGSAGVGLSLYYRTRPQPVTQLRCHADGKLETRQGDVWKALECPDPAMLLPWLAVLRYRQPGARRVTALVITPDSLPEDDFRRLRVWMRWGMKTTSKATAAHEKT